MARSEVLQLNFDMPLEMAATPDGQSLRIEVPAGVRAKQAGYAPRLGSASLQFEGGDETQRRARVVPDPDVATNRVLEFAVSSPNVILRDPGTGALVRKARVQMNVYGNVGVGEVYQSVRLRLDDGFEALADSTQTFDWLTLSEWWNNAGWTGERWPFRISLDLTNRGNNGRPGLFLHARATQKPPHGQRWSVTAWDQLAGDWSLPVRQWMRMEIWYREGDVSNGRFVVAVTMPDAARRVLIDVTGPTHHPAQAKADGLAHFNPLKLYTSRKLVEAVRISAPRLALQWDDLIVQPCASARSGETTPCERAMNLR